ncbi:MAG: DMT family transporter [Tissierella sp.]|uniref:DMT family transporter n=1 Tax=Tissierella sp. TaxID=41274 RepID=UPI003F9A266B
MDKEKLLPISAAVTYSVIFGLSFLFAKMGLTTMNTIELVAYRFLIASIVLTALKLFKVIKIDLQGKRLKIVVLTAILQPVLYFLFEVKGIDLSTTSESGLVLSLIPIFVAIFARIFLDERLLKSQIAFIFLSVSGVVLINIMKDKTASSGSYLGVLLLFMAVISGALYNIGSKKASTNFTPVEITYVMMWIGAISFNAILFVMKAYNGTLNEYFTPMFSVNSLISLSYLAILSSIIAFFCLNYSISKLPVYQSAIFGNISTVVAILAGVIILKEDFGLYDIVGAIMIITGILGTIYMGEKKLKEDLHQKGI